MSFNVAITGAYGYSKDYTIESNKRLNKCVLTLKAACRLTIRCAAQAPVTYDDIDILPNPLIDYINCNDH